MIFYSISRFFAYQIPYETFNKPQDMHLLVKAGPELEVFDETGGKTWR